MYKDLISDYLMLQFVVKSRKGDIYGDTNMVDRISSRTFNLYAQSFFSGIIYYIVYLLDQKIIAKKQ